MPGLAASHATTAGMLVDVAVTRTVVLVTVPGTVVTVVVIVVLDGCSSEVGVADVLDDVVVTVVDGASVVVVDVLLIDVLLIDVLLLVVVVARPGSLKT